MSVRVAPASALKSAIARFRGGRGAPRLGHPSTRWVGLLAGCVAIAALSLLKETRLNFDVWSWLVWGREVRQLSLDTTAGHAAWKPLPVLFTIPASVFGDAAPHVWLVLVRTAWLLCFVAAYRVGKGLAGRPAGFLGAFGLLTIPTPHADWLYYFLAGTSEPLVVACALGAIDCHMTGRRSWAVLLGCLAALGRPEAWPFVCLYAIHAGRAEPERRALVVTLVAAVPAVWLGGGLWGSGNPLGAVSSAQRVAAAGPAPPLGPSAPVLLVFVREAGRLLTAPLWLMALIALVRVAREAFKAPGPSRTRVLLGTGALAWIALVGGLSLFGLPALPRFMIVPAAVLALLAGAGVVELVKGLRQPIARRAAVCALAFLILASTHPRTARLTPQLTRKAPRGLDRLPQALERADARRQVTRCGGAAVLVNSREAGPAELAWRLGIPIRAVGYLPGKNTQPRIQSGLVVVRQRGPSSKPKPALLPGLGGPGWTQLAAQGRWAVYTVNCAPPGTARAGTVRPIT